ncbi:hypothetical protein BgAZ_206510 [Babesia gibsoni]|uniref:t-SNARE coiled-coil homology domain-containing protein n=1 Tax=Babesia gibsoni TaxID=33632 RepID=A0AAD8PEC6_BABGI|nr:hypothetical protein BgAZ_206510 [Babesia gibsoni]
MSSRYGISTLAAMASRNTKAANKAKSAMKAFRLSVNKIIHDVESESTRHASVDSVQAAIKRVKSEAKVVLEALHAYSEELSSKNESRELYDSLLKEFKEYMDKLEDIQSKMALSIPSTTGDDGTIAKEETYENETGSQQVMQEMQQTKELSPLESQILEERSQQIQDLRSNVYGVRDIYVQIGDIVEYQGDQLDDIESSMAHAFEDTLETNIHLREAAARRGGSWSRWISMIILIACLIIIIIIYRKL